MIDNKNISQTFFGRLFFYVNAIDMTILQALNTIAVEKVNPRECALGDVCQFLNYKHPSTNFLVYVCVSEMVLKIRLDASFQILDRERSHSDKR